VLKMLQIWTVLLMLAVSGFFARNTAQAAEPAPAAADDGQAERFRTFEQTLSGAVLDGQYTIVGQDEPPLRREQYTIQSVRKLPDGDFWLFQTRIKYSDKDVTVPLPLEVKWAGDTPVITLTKLTIPGLGTFSSRVVIDGTKYAGTWSHDDVGGHLFGTIKPRVDP
jgi:hypothetical protein